MKNIPSKTVSNPVRSRILSVFLYILAGLFIIPAAILANMYEGKGLYFVGALLAGIAWLLFYNGLRLAAPSIEKLLTKDPRPPVLYLRSFSLDGKIYEETSQIHSFLSILWLLINWPIKWFYRLPFMQTIEKWGGNTVELQVIENFKEIGPVIAVGKPGERLPTLGAARTYVGDDWQDHVIRFVKMAGLVVIQPGISEHVVWEIQVALQNTDPRRVLLLFWETSDAEYEKFAASARSRVSLPPVNKRRGEELVRFDASGFPRFDAIPKKGVSALIIKLQKELSTLS